MNRKQNLFFGFAVMLIAAIFTLTLAGCGLSDSGTKNVTIIIKNTGGSPITGVAVSSNGLPFTGETKGAPEFYVGSASTYDKTITVAAGSEETLEPITIANNSYQFMVYITKKPDGAGSPTTRGILTLLPVRHLFVRDIYEFYPNGWFMGFFAKDNRLPETLTLTYDGKKLKRAKK